VTGDRAVCPSVLSFFFFLLLRLNKKVEAFSPKSPTEVAYPKQGAHKRWVDLQRSLFLLMNEALNSESFVREF
jgi:hypothetical protein